MRTSGDWMPGGMAAQLTKAKGWGVVIGGYGVPWGISAGECTAFGACVDSADAALTKVSDKTTRTMVDIAHGNEVFKTLRASMRLMKNLHFTCPPRAVEELAMLGLPPPKTPEKVAEPRNQVSVKTRNLGDHQLKALLTIETVPGQDRAASDFGVRFFIAIEDPAAAPGTESRYGKYLGTPPQSGSDFSWSLFTRKLRVTLDFTEQDRGKKAWFIARLETGTGLKGPWGPLFWTIIP